MVAGKLLENVELIIASEVGCVNQKSYIICADNFIWLSYAQELPLKKRIVSELDMNRKLKVICAFWKIHPLTIRKKRNLGSIKETKIEEK